MLTTELMDTIANLLPQPSTPTLPSTGENDSTIAPHSTAKTVSVIESQSVS